MSLNILKLKTAEATIAALQQLTTAQIQARDVERLECIRNPTPADRAKLVVERDRMTDAVDHGMLLAAMAKAKCKTINETKYIKAINALDKAIHAILLSRLQVRHSINGDAVETMHYCNVLETNARFVATVATSMLIEIAALKVECEPLQIVPRRVFFVRCNTAQDLPKAARPTFRLNNGEWIGIMGSCPVSHRDDRFDSVVCNSEIASSSSVLREFFADNMPVLGD